MVMKSSDGEVPGAAGLYSFLFYLLVQIADEIPLLSLFPPPHHSLLIPQLCSCNCLWDFAGNGTFKMSHLWKNFRKLLCFSTTDSCGLAYSFAPCAITSEKLSRQKSVMLKQEQDWRRDTKVVLWEGIAAPIPWGMQPISCALSMLNSSWQNCGHFNPSPLFVQ